MNKKVKNCILSIGVLGLICILGSWSSKGKKVSSKKSNASMADAAAIVADIPTTQYFTDEAVAKSDIETILLAGVNSPSAINKQPWHFTAITDKSIMAEISAGMSFGGAPTGGKAPDGKGGPADGKNPPPSDADRPAPPAGGGGKKAGVGDTPLAIVVSCKAGSEFDAGLACQNMSVEAVLLGYDTKIVSSPIIALNGEKQDYFRELLGIPKDQAAVAVLLVGKAGGDTDASSGATERNPFNDVVTVK